jgi:hypothetical protein
MKRVKDTSKEEPRMDDILNFYVVHNGALSAEKSRVIVENLRDFGVKVVAGREEVGNKGTAFVFRGGNEGEWFAQNRPDLNVVTLSENLLQALTKLYEMFGRTLPPILQEGSREETAVEVETVVPEVLEWAVD